MEHIIYPVRAEGLKILDSQNNLVCTAANLKIVVQIVTILNTFLRM